MMESCAACGKADVSLKSCKACKLVKYCGVDCQVAHRPAHKKACRIRAAELFDGELFAEPPRREECIICCIILPFDFRETSYMNCCGKTICCGCRYNMPRFRCPFCNMDPADDDEEMIRRIFERIEKYNDPEAMDQLGGFYAEGTNGFTVDHVKAVEWYQRGSELGHSIAHYNLAGAYLRGEGVQVNRKKAIHHYQIAAMMGVVDARCKLGAMEGLNGNHDRAMRHMMMAARCGDNDSLVAIKNGFMMGNVTKEDYEITLREHKASRDEEQSDRRDRIRAAKGL